MRHLRKTLVGAALTLAAAAAIAQVPAGYPASYADTIAAAKKEGKVVVYSTTGLFVMTFGRLPGQPTTASLMGGIAVICTFEFFTVWDRYVVPKNYITAR
jgi:hypothetical protein